LRIDRTDIVDAAWADNGPGGLATAPYDASQGTVLGRHGRIHVSRDGDDTIWVGGGPVTCVSGDVEL